MTPWTAAPQASLSLTIFQFTQTHVRWVSDATKTSYPLSPLLLLPSVFPSIRVISNELALHIRYPKYWSFNFSTSPSNEYWGLISFRTDWSDLLSVQGTLESLQHHNSKASVLQCSTFFMIQLSHLYMTAGKTITLTMRTFVSKVMSLLFNTLSVSDTDYPFTYLLVLCTSSLENVYSDVFVLLFLWPNCMSTLFILDINTLSGIWSINIFWYLVGCLSFCWWFPLLYRSSFLWCSPTCLICIMPNEISQAENIISYVWNIKKNNVHNKTEADSQIQKTN